MKKIVLISPPASGKGTQARMLTEKYNIPHISTGMLLRDEIESSSDLGNIIKEDMRLGNFISDDIIFELITKRLSDVDCENGYILDGFPRNIKQAEHYQQVLSLINKEIDYAFYLEVSKEIALKRAIGRLNCTNCGAVYNDMFEDSKPNVLETCDICHSKLTRRSDDTELVFENRYQVYLKETAPLIKFYNSLNKLHYIDSSISKEVTFEQITNILDNGDSYD